jgi:integrase
MNKSMVVVSQNAVAGTIDPVRLRENFRKFSAKHRSANTLKTYGSQWPVFTRWCLANGRQPLPASVETVAAYFEHMYAERRTLATLTVAISAIRYRHAQARVDDPIKSSDIDDMLGGMRRAMGEEGLTERHVKPVISIDDLLALSRACGDTPMGKRDRALILCAFAGWLRRGEPLKFRAERIEWRDDVAIVRLGVTKTDQTGTAGEFCTLPKLDIAELCPYRALREWLDLAQITDGPVFLKLTRGVVTRRPITDPGYVNVLLARVATAAGIPTARIAPHRAFRASPITIAHKSGASIADMMQKARHKNMNTTMKYVHESAEGNAALGRRVYAQAARQM